MRYIKLRLQVTSCLLLALISLCWCIYRDIQIEKEYTGDLRNRIVGSRLQMDGRSPYFYHWKSADGVRYFDPSNKNTTFKLSNVTATPFFHQLLYPISNLQQRTISRIWLAFEYLALLIMTMLAFQFAKNKKQKWIVLFISLSFLYSYAWTTHIEVGQVYIFIPLLAMLFYFFITRKTSLWDPIFAGICAMSLLLIRPTTLLYLLPFLLLIKQYSKKYLALLLVSSSFVLVFAFGSDYSRQYWSDYRKAMLEHVKIHQGFSSIQQRNEPIPKYENWEGWNEEQIKKDSEQFHYYKPNAENGNVFVFLNLGLHIRTPIWVLSVLCVCFMTFICLGFYKRIWNTSQFGHRTIALTGFCLYMASDIFSPIHRAHYNAVQWIFPLLLIASVYSVNFRKIFVIGVLAGLFLNSVTTRLFPMEHSVGEYVIYASILGLLFTFKPEFRK